MLLPCTSLLTSRSVMRSISPKRATSPTACAYPSYFGLTFRPVKSSIIMKKNLPPSRAGIGIILRTARFSERSATHASHKYKEGESVLNHGFVAEFGFVSFLFINTSIGTFGAFPRVKGQRYLLTLSEKSRGHACLICRYSHGRFCI